LKLAQALSLSNFSVAATGGRNVGSYFLHSLNRARSLGVVQVRCIRGVNKKGWQTQDGWRREALELLLLLSIDSKATNQ
jgi:hypothetical protein